MDAETETVESLANLLTELGPKVQEVAEAAEAASRAALEEAAAIGKALEQTVDKVEQLVSVDFAFLVAELRQHVEAAVGSVISFMSETCDQMLDKKEAEWREKLAAVRELMETSIEKVEVHTKEVGTHTEEKWTKLLGDELAEIEGEANTLIGELGSFTKAVEQKEAQVKVAASMVEERQQQNADAVANVERELNNVRGRWGTFGITC
jgi:hypothetical protein